MPSYPVNPLPLTLVLEDGTGLTNSNTYISVTDANTYFSAHLYASDWTGATDDTVRGRALAMATAVIDRTVEFNGYRKSTTQALEWPRLECPRVGLSQFAYIDSIRRIAVYWSEYEVPNILAKATAELAKELLKVDRTIDDPSKGVAHLGLGNGAIDIDFNPSDRKIVFTDQVMNYLRQLGRIRGARTTTRVKRVQ